MRWFSWLFKEDVPATNEQKNLIIEMLQTCEVFYRHYSGVVEYQQYAEALKELREDSKFFQELTQDRFERLQRLLIRPWYTDRYPGVEKLAFQQMLRKERLSKESQSE